MDSKLYRPLMILNQQLVVMAAEEPVELNCPICLDRINNIAYLDCCDHMFCVHCIQEWTNIQAHCPVCRQLISFIFHSLEETVLEEFMASFDSSTPSMWFLFIVAEEESQTNEEENTPGSSAMTETAPLLNDQLEMDQRENVSIEEEEHAIVSDAQPTFEQMPEVHEPPSDSEGQHLQSPNLIDSRWGERSARRSQSSPRSHSRSHSRSRSPSRPHH
ncbi:E3 ubiquitin-protein ligase Topors-like [Arapaima gigas]